MPYTASTRAQRPEQAALHSSKTTNIQEKEKQQHTASALATAACR
jgi:hypothetical protein